MNSMEQFTQLKRKRDSFAAMRWTAQKPALRLFLPDNGRRTEEFSLDAADDALFSEACDITENEGGSDISYAASYELGSAMKSVVLRHLDKRLARLAKDAKSEAESVLAEFAKPPPARMKIPCPDRNLPAGMNSTNFH